MNRVGALFRFKKGAAPLRPHSMMSLVGTLRISVNESGFSKKTGGRSIYIEGDDARENPRF
jgi:hypothetical protein